MMIKKIGVILAIILCCLSGCSKKQVFKEDINIVTINDIHYLASSLRNDSVLSQDVYNLRNGQMVLYASELLDSFVQEMISLKPDIVIVAGDLTFNGEKLSHQELAAKFQQLQDNGIQVFVLPGNHDIRNPYAYDFTQEELKYTDTVEVKDFKEIYYNFGFKQADYQDKDSLSYLVKLNDQEWLMMIDANQYESNTMFGIVGEGSLKDSTKQWIVEMYQKANDNGARILQVTHQSWLRNEGIHTEDYRIRNSYKIIPEIAKLVNKSVIISGHIHTQSIVKQEEGESTFYEIATEALAVAPHQYGYIQLTPNSFDYQLKQVDVSKYYGDSEDENLKDFTSYSTEFFRKVSYDLFKKNYSVYEIAAQDIDQMAKLMADINVYYFAGDQENLLKLKDSEGYKVYLKNQDKLDSTYFKSIFNKKELDQQSFHLDF